jgi:DNA-binding Xre family transcriptional regulator
MEPQIIKAPNGEELVIITRAEYEALLEAREELQDIAIAEERMTALKEGRYSILPQEVSDAMMRGDSLLKAIRKWRGLTQMDLASRTGLGQGYISDIEAKRRRGTKETLEQIAKALEIDPSWLV